MYVVLSRRWIVVARMYTANTSPSCALQKITSRYSEKHTFQKELSVARIVGSKKTFLVSA